MIKGPTYSELIEAEIKGQELSFGHSYKPKKRLAPVEVKFGHERPDYTMQDFRNDPEVVKDFETVIDYLGNKQSFLSAVNLATSPSQDDDPVEFLRDDFMRVETALSKANAFKDAPEEVKSAYRRMRQKFDNAEVYDWSEQVHRVLDYGTDLIFNYENAAALGAAALSAGPTMGTGVAASAAARKGAGTVATKALDLAIRAGKGAKEGAQKALKPTAVKSGLYYGGYGAAADAASQSLEIVTGMRDQWNPVETAIAGAVTGTLGLGLYHGGKALSKMATRRSVEDIAYDTPMLPAPATLALPAPARALPDLRLPQPERPSGPAISFQEQLEALVNSPGQNFKRSVEELLQARKDAPENFKLAIQNALQEANPAQKISQLLGEATGNTQRQLLLDLRDTLEDVVSRGAQKPSTAASKFHFELAKLVSERTGGSIPFGARFAVELSQLIKKRQDAPENFKKAIEEAMNQPRAGKKIRQIINDFLKNQTDDVADETQIDRVNADILRAIRAEGENKANLPAVISKLPSIRKLIEEVGGGQQTYEKVVDAALAAANGTPQSVQSQLLYNLNKVFTGFTSKYMFGKSATFLSPYSNISGTAKLLQEKVSGEFALGIKAGQKRIEEDFAEAQRRITGGFFKEYLTAVMPLSRDKFNVSIDDAINAQLSLAIRGRGSDNSSINEAAKRIRRSYQAAGELLHREGFISTPVTNYVPRMWKRSAIESNRDEFAGLLVRSGEAKTTKEAQNIINGMLEKQYQLSSGSKDYFFSSNRTFENITDDAMFEKFLNNDVQQTFFNYMQQAGMALAKKRVFGIRNLKEFEEKWLVPISREVRNGGGGWSANESEQIRDLYKVITGEGVETASGVNQGIQLVQRMALLPLATLSSLTEILLNFGVAGGAASLKGISAGLKISGAKNKQDIANLMEAYETGFKGITSDSHKKLVDEFGLTPEEAWHEMQEFGLVMEQSLESMADRLAGDMVTNKAMQTASDKFFRITFLDQWTKFVQNVSFQTGKRLIYRHIDDIVEHGNAPITRRIQSKMDDLAEFGVDVEKAKAWASRGKNRNDDFYKEIANGAARYTNQIILQPSRQSGLKPRAHTTPAGSLLFQLMGYPTAFTNNILKRGLKRLVRDKEIAFEKLGPTALMMTAVAGASNYASTRGEGYNDKTAAEIGVESLMRWGGAGILFDQVYRARENAEYLGTPGLVAGMFGPTVTDAVGAIAYQKPIRVLGTKIPGYGLGTTVFGKDVMQDYRTALSDIDTEIKEAIIPSKRTYYAKGGEVENVPNVPTEPDERIDKLTGFPYNQQAGQAFIDEEDMPISLLARDK